MFSFFPHVPLLLADVSIKKSNQHRSAEGPTGILVLLLANFGPRPTGFRRDCDQIFKVYFDFLISTLGVAYWLMY